MSTSAVLSSTTSTGIIYSHAISTGKTATIEYGRYVFNINWSQWHENGDCNATELASGTGHMMPTVGFEYIHYQASGQFKPEIRRLRPT